MSVCIHFNGMAEIGRKDDLCLLTSQTRQAYLINNKLLPGAQVQHVKPKACDTARVFFLAKSRCITREWRRVGVWWSGSQALPGYTYLHSCHTQRLLAGAISMTCDKYTCPSTAKLQSFGSFSHNLQASSTNEFLFQILTNNHGVICFSCGSLIWVMC